VFEPHGLNCKEIPYSEIERRGAGMYRGIARGKQAMAGAPSGQRRGSRDRPLQFEPTKSQDSISDLST
jgi:hypothetical protein